MKQQPKEQRSEPQPVTLPQAQQRLEQIGVHRARLTADRTRLEQRLEAAQHESSRKYLQGDRSGLQEMGTLRVEREVIEGALALLQQEESAASVDLQRAKVFDLKEQAQRKRVELERLNTETQTLLSKLSELEGVSFTPSILSSQPLPGAWLKPETLREPEPWLGVLELALNIPGQRNLATPRSRRLRAEIEQLEIDAETLERQISRESLNAA